MADTRVQHEVEDWIRTEWLPQRHHQAFSRQRVTLGTGGDYSFAAVSADRSIIATICTGHATTAGGKLAVGKLMKLRSDMLFLTMAPAAQRLVVSTEPDMHERCGRELEAGRVPPGIEFVLASIPSELDRRLVAARRVSSNENSSLER